MPIKDNKKKSAKLKKRKEQEKVISQNFASILTVLENARKKSQGMASFYRTMLEEESKHDAAVLAASKIAIEKEVKPAEEIEIEPPREKKLADEARQINDEGEVVDKRQLLKGGLNVRPKDSTNRQASKSSYQADYEARRTSQKDKIREREARQRQQNVIE